MKLLPCVTFILLVYAPFARAQEQETLDSLESIYHDARASDTLRTLSMVEIAKQYYRNKPDTAILLADMALQWSEKNEYDKGRARALNVIGLGHWMKSNHSDALSYYQKALPFFERSGDLQGYGLCLNNIGLVYFYQGDYPNAIDYFQKAHAIHARDHYAEGSALALNNLGLAYEQKNDLAKALSFYQQALAIYQDQRHKQGIGQSLTNIGYAYLALDRADLALAAFAKAVSIQETILDRSTLISSLIGIAGVYKDQKKFNAAITNADRALTISREVKSTYDEREATIILYRIYKEKGDAAHALEYHEQFKILSDTIFSLENNKAIASLEARVELENKQKQFEMLEKENALRQRINYVTALGLIGMALLSFFIFWNRRKLKSAYNKLEEANLRLTHIKQQMEAKAVMLGESNHAKDKMFSVISHDLRSPLNAVRGMFDLVNTGQLSSVELASFMPEIGKKVNNASEILEELLEWSKTQMMSQEAHQTNVSIRDLLDQARERFIPQAREKGVNIVVDSSDNCKAYADVDMMRAVLRNLVANAIKFSRTGDVITLRSSASDGEVLITVSDTGVGIKPEHLDKLFQASGFTTQGTANEKGTGLGLMLCREFVEKNGGSIRVESTVGKGSAFTITLPSARTVKPVYMPVN